MATSLSYDQIYVQAAQYETFYKNQITMMDATPADNPVLASGDAALDPLTEGVTLTDNAAQLSTTIANGKVQFVGGTDIPVPPTDDPNAANYATIQMRDTFDDAVTALQTVRVTFTPMLTGTIYAQEGGVSFEFDVGDVTSLGNIIVGGGGSSSGSGNGISDTLSTSGPQTVTLLAGHTYRIGEYVSAAVAGQQQEGRAPLTSSLDVMAGFTVQQFDDFGLPVQGNPDLQFDSGRDYEPALACYLGGTHVGTAAGDVPVEALAVGDLVVIATGQHRPIRWIGRRSYAGRFLAANPAVQPIRFQAGSLGAGLPRRDLLVSPNHSMFLDGVLVAARLLVNGTTIVQQRGLEQVEYFHVELDSHDVLLAEGAPSESFVDDDSRGVFHNAAEWERLYPGREHVPAVFCAPRVDSGPALETIRRRLDVVGGQVAQAA